MKKISRIRWLTTLMGLVVLMFTCAGCGQTAAQSNVPKPDASQSRVRIYESMVELEDDSPLIITGEISRTSVIRDIDDITDFTLLDVKVSQTLKGTVNSGSIIVRQTGSAEQGSAETLLQTGDVVMLFLTPTDLPGEQSSQYYVTGATAGVYRVTDDTQQSWNVLRSQHGNASDAWQPVFERVNVDSGDELPSELTPAQVYEQVKDSRYVSGFVEMTFDGSTHAAMQFMG